MSWKRLHRKTVIDTKFLKVYNDTVELPNGTIIDDYSIIEKPSYIMIVAIDEQKNVITLNEYKYAIDETSPTLPAGHIGLDEQPLEAAKRELLEETGYSGGEWEYLGVHYDYPSKDCHKAHFVKATQVRKTHDIKHEETENISVRLISISILKEEIKNKEWTANAPIAALVAAGILS